jgi:hypothetical protein
MSVSRSLVIMFGVVAALTIAMQPVAAQKRKDKDAAQPFIVETRIAAPKRVGEFELESTYYDPATKHAGASLRYLLPDHPEIRFDLFVYPAGDMPHDTAMTSGMKDFVASFDAGVQMKYYTDLKIIDTVDFEIVPKAGTPAHHDDKPTVKTSPESEADAIIEAALAPKPISSKRIELRYSMRMDETGETVPMRSRGYLFYKQLYYFKGRISVAESRMDQATFDTLSDRAMRELVPVVQASNIGGCAKTEIVIGGEALDEGKAGIDALMTQMLGQMADSNGKHCFADRERAVSFEPDNAEIITIEYDPDDWGSQ